MPFQAADIVQLVGIGRNEYIAIMNKCKAKKLLWRVNKSIAKEYLPVTPLDLNMQPWWTVGVVNLSEHLLSCIFPSHHHYTLPSADITHVLHHSCVSCLKQQHLHHWLLACLQPVVRHDVICHVTHPAACTDAHTSGKARDVATGEQEHRALSPEELKACQEGCKPGAKVADMDRQLLQQLYKKGLIHLDVPIRPEDHVSIPPLEV